MPKATTVLLTAIASQESLESESKVLREEGVHQRIHSRVAIAKPEKYLENDRVDTVAAEGTS